MTWQLAILPKMLFFQIFTQLIISHSLNLVSDMNSSEKVSPHPLTKAALLCPMPVPWTSTLPMKIEITWSQKYWLYVLHCKSRTKYNIWHILSTQDISVSWNTGIFLKVPYSYVYKYTHTHIHTPFLPQMECWWQSHLPTMVENLRVGSFPVTSLYNSG